MNFYKQRLTAMIDERYGHLIEQYDREPVIEKRRSDKKKEEKEATRKYMRNYMHTHRKKGKNGKGTEN